MVHLGCLMIRITGAKDWDHIQWKRQDAVSESGKSDLYFNKKVSVGFQNRAMYLIKYHFKKSSNRKTVKAYKTSVSGKDFLV